jgi:hypothetical protein
VRSGGEVDRAAGALAARQRAGLLVVVEPSPDAREAFGLAVELAWLGLARNDGELGSMRVIDLRLATVQYIRT